MSEYIITKRLVCHRCLGTGWVNDAQCPRCDRKGFTETYHDFDEVLLSRLAKLQFALVTVTGDYENERQSLWDLEFRD